MENPRSTRRSTEYTVSNIAGGDARTFHTQHGQPSDASIRHARRQGPLGFACSDPDIHDMIATAINDRDEQER